LIVRDGNRASAVIRRIREFLKKENPQTVSLDLNDVVQEALVFARGELIKRRVAVRAELAAGIPRVRADRIQLQQVLINLIMNAAEAMAAVEGGELLVASRESGDGEVEVAVRDAGPGMNPQDLARMFDAFFTTKRNGMGMGLSISRTIVEAHGGRIWAERNDGPGLTVRFGLPAEAANQTAGGLA
jgi:signal transduction histidine kinase